MSDCSTNAMKPNLIGKSPTVATFDEFQPKTCGNCGYSCGHKTKLYGCVYCYVPCLLHGTFEHETNRCSDWKKRILDTQDQRYQQLEQVACSALNSADTLLMILQREGVAVAEQQLFTNRLKKTHANYKALGVSLDD